MSSLLSWICNRSNRLWACFFHVVHLFRIGVDRRELADAALWTWESRDPLSASYHFTHQLNSESEFSLAARRLNPAPRDSC